MPYILRKVGNTPNVPTKYFECDNESDMSLISVIGVPMGSECYVINTGATYALNSLGEWKLKPTSTSGGGGGGGGGDTPGGNDIVYDGGEEV